MGVPLDLPTAYRRQLQLCIRDIYKRHYRLGDAVLARVHLYVNLESGHNHTNPGDGTTESLDVEHHRYHVVVHRRQRIRTPTVINAAAFRQS